ncbi:MAG: hypothetical protein N2171_02020 [Clostridia bacterium]|nr:hypothetical protein [Clostridia bacterium]
MNRQNGNPVLVRESFENTDISVIVGVLIDVGGYFSYSLERINDDQHRVRMRFQEILDLVFQPFSD